jgi:crossover junction endodeoxyribonuclease RusA
VQRLTVVLPLPPKELSPNARVHWGRKARMSKRYKLAAMAATDGALVEAGRPEGMWDAAQLKVCLYNRTAHRRSSLNLIASMKSAFDGIAISLGVDDAHWVHLPPVQEKDAKDPRVEVLILYLPKTR